jgi:hypothetical protein
VLKQYTSIEVDLLGVKDEKGDLVADSHSIMVRWRNCFFQILNVHGVSDVRQA